MPEIQLHGRQKKKKEKKREKRQKDEKIKEASHRALQQIPH